MAGGSAGNARWRKAAASAGGNTNCVEVSFRDGSVLVRNSRDRGGSVLVFTAGEWAAFLDGVRHGEFDQGDSHEIS